ncbi:MAG TPA: Ig-like domain-containing protein, partial [Nitrospirota bacterium]|nr:Ig-like domain-containing protein [Nitrospirota bacterium]
FNEPVAAASVSDVTFTLSGGVTGRVTYDPKTKTATFTPDRPLSFNHTYTITISAGVMSLGNVPMSSEFTSTFTTNAAPAAPHLYSPTDGSVIIGPAVSLQWIASTDSDAENVTYHLFYCTNPSMTGCNPVDVSSSATTTTASAFRNPQSIGGFGAGLVLAGFAIIGGVTSRRKIFFIVAALLITGSAVAACGKKSSEPPAPPAGLTTKSISELQAGTRYWWKVVADDGNGGTAESETWSFTTQ